MEAELRLLAAQSCNVNSCNLAARVIVSGSCLVVASLHFIANRKLLIANSVIYDNILLGATIVISSSQS